MKLVPKVNLDLVVNIAILVTCAILGGAVLQRHSAVATRTTVESPPMVKAGDRADQLPGLSFADANGTLLLYAKSTCHYCTESMQFYRRMRDQTRQLQGFRFVVVGIESSEVLQRYLDEHGVNADRVISAPGNPKPTPTLILVDNHGVVRDAWIGLQNGEGEQRVLRQIQSATGRPAATE